MALDGNGADPIGGGRPSALGKSPARKAVSPAPASPAPTAARADAAEKSEKSKRKRGKGKNARGAVDAAPPAPNPTLAKTAKEEPGSPKHFAFSSFQLSPEPTVLPKPSMIKAKK